MRLLIRCLVLALSGCVSSFTWLPAQAAAPPTLLQAPLERADVTIPFWWMPHDAPRATLVLLIGGTRGGVGDDLAALAAHPNFLTRSRELFHKAGFSVAIVGRASDRTGLDHAYRKSFEHSRDIRAVLLRLKKLAPKDIWLVGTSLGTISAANAAISSPDLVAGLALTASYGNPESPNKVQSLELRNIRMPTLVLHHRRDACRGCPPDGAKDIVSDLASARHKELIFISGGSGASGDPCGPLHYHGFINQEEEAVVHIASWIRAHGQRP